MPNQQILNAMNQGAPTLLSEQMAAEDMAMARGYAETMGSIADTQAQQFSNQQLSERSNILKEFEGRTDTPEFRSKMGTVDPQTAFDFQSQAMKLEESDRKALDDKFKVVGNLLLQLDTEEKFNNHPISQQMSWGQIPDVLSRALEASDILKMTGGGDQSVRDQKISELIARNIDPNTAADIADGRVKVTSPDSFGNIYTVNTVTNEKKLVSGSGGQTPQQQEPIQPVQKGESIAKAAMEGTGPISSAQQGISNLFGFMWEGQMFPENARARQRLNLFNKAAQESLIQNPRFPVAEQQFVKSLLPSTEQIFKDPDDSVSNLAELRNHLEAKIDANTRSISGSEITEKRRGDLSNQNDAMKRVLSLMGDQSSGASRLDLARKIADGTASDEEYEEYATLRGQ